MSWPLLVPLLENQVPQNVDTVLGMGMASGMAVGIDGMSNGRYNPSMKYASSPNGGRTLDTATNGKGFGRSYDRKSLDRNPNERDYLDLALDVEDRLDRDYRERLRGSR